ncbi:MAG: ABC transporter permease [Candidatus Acidiferrales bacterium]
MDSFTAQLKQVFRRLRRAPLFTFLTLLMLAAGVGANIAVFSVLEGVLLKPLPYPHPEQLAGVWLDAPPANLFNMPLGPSDYFVFRDQNRTFQDIGLYSSDSVGITGIGLPERVLALQVTDGTLPILGIRPAIGRYFSRQEDLPGAPLTTVLSYAYWQSKFGGDPAVIGRTIIVDGKSRQIIGVMPRNFRFLDERNPSLFLPFQFDRNKIFLGNFSWDALARLKPGATIAEAETDVARMLPIVMRSFPPPPGFSLDLFKKAGFVPNLHQLKEDVVGNVGTLLWVLMGGIGMVLLIACANVANLFLVRTEGRQQELAIRAALGASRQRLAGELLFESLIIGLIGSALGLGVAYAAIRFLVALAPSGLPRIGNIGVDGHVLLFTLAIAIFTSVLFGSVPVLKYAGVTAGTGLREGGRTLSASRARHRTRNTLVTVQVALAFVLSICAGLMIRTFYALTHVNPGFTGPAEVQTFRISIPASDVHDDTQVPRVEEQIQDKLAAIPGVSSVGVSIAVPMDGNNWMDPIFAADRAYEKGQTPALCHQIMISAGYLHTMGIPLIAGRDFTWADIYNEIPVVLISENFARKYWGTPQNVLGKRIRISSIDDWRQIIGVVGNVYDEGMNRPAPNDVYWPNLLAKFEGGPLFVARDVAFALRTPLAGSQALMNEVRQAVWSVDANLPLANVHTLEYFYDQSIARTSFTLIMLGIAGAMALLLGTVGLYGVIAYSVSQRTREIGIRMALGAQQKEVTGMFVRQGLLLTSIGIASGLVAAFAAMRLMSSLLFHVSPVDPVTYAAVTVGLVAAALLASYLPSRRAANVNPVEALRAE